MGTLLLLLDVNTGHTTWHYYEQLRHVHSIARMRLRSAREFEASPITIGRLSLGTPDPYMISNLRYVDPSFRHEL